MRFVVFFFTFACVLLVKAHLKNEHKRVSEVLRVDSRRKHGGNDPDVGFGVFFHEPGFVSNAMRPVIQEKRLNKADASVSNFLEQDICFVGSVFAVKDCLEEFYQCAPSGRYIQRKCDVGYRFDRSWRKCRKLTDMPNCQTDRKRNGMDNRVAGAPVVFVSAVPTFSGASEIPAGFEFDGFRYWGPESGMHNYRNVHYASGLVPFNIGPPITAVPSLSDFIPNIPYVAPDSDFEPIVSESNLFNREGPSVALPQEVKNSMNTAPSISNIQNAPVNPIPNAHINPIPNAPIHPIPNAPIHPIPNAPINLFSPSPLDLPNIETTPKVEDTERLVQQPMMPVESFGDIKQPAESVQQTSEQMLLGQPTDVVQKINEQTPLEQQVDAIQKTNERMPLEQPVEAVQGASEQMSLESRNAANVPSQAEEFFSGPRVSSEQKQQLYEDQTNDLFNQNAFDKLSLQNQGFSQIESDFPKHTEYLSGGNLNTEGKSMTVQKEKSEMDGVEGSGYEDADKKVRQGAEAVDHALKGDVDETVKEIVSESSDGTKGFFPAATDHKGEKSS